MQGEESTPTPPTRFETAFDPPFVGRSRETASLHRIVAEVLAGSTRIVAIAGEPGIGKTRLAHETATFASRHGFQVFWGRCNESGWAPSYWPWIQIIRSYITASDRKTVQSLMGKRAMHIGEVVEEVRDLLPDLPHPDPVEPQVRRYLFFQAATGFIERASQRQPLLLIIDDLHWADTSSLHLLEFLTQSIHDGRVLLIATYRNVSMSSSHPLTPTLGELARNPSFVQMSLEPFSADDVAVYFAGATGGAIPPEIASRLHGRTEGNPLYVSEMTKLLALHELQPTGLMDVPETVQLAIGQRLELPC